MNKVRDNIKPEQIRKTLKETLDRIYSGDFKLENLDFVTLLQATLQWFEYYQGLQDHTKMRDLYKKLIKEELSEISEAWHNADIIEVLDGNVDYLWVTLGYIYFSALDDTKNLSEESRDEEIIDRITEGVNQLLEYIIIPKDLFLLAWLEVAYSNWTKSLELRDDNDEEGKAGKVIKGDNYEAPNLQRVFEFFKDNKQQ